MSSKVTISNNLQESGFLPSHDLMPFLRTVQQRRFGKLKIDKPKYYWDAEYFSLGKVNLWNEIDDDGKSRVLSLLTNKLLEESFYIEKSGMTYTAKMALMADKNDERCLYNMMAADEALHFQLISQHLLREPESYKTQDFLLLLDEAVHEAGFSTLILIAQVLLEGWGLAHYLSLLKNCKSESLSLVFKSILQDEAIHHGSGLVLTQKHKPVGADRDMVKVILKQFFGLVRVGPVRVVSALGSSVGGLTQTQCINVFDELDASNQINENLLTLKKLLGENGGLDLVDFIEKQKLDKPVSSNEFGNICKGQI